MHDLIFEISPKETPFVTVSPHRNALKTIATFMGTYEYTNAMAAKFLDNWATSWTTLERLTVAGKVSTPH